MSSCSSCGAPAVPGARACGYCGTFLAMEPLDPETNLVGQAWGSLQQLRSIGIPQYRDILVQVVWWSLVVMTFGIVALFWRRPKGHCSKVGHDLEMRRLRFLLRAAGQSSPHPTAAYHLEFISSEADLLATEVQAARKRNRWVLVGVLAALLVLSAIGRTMEDENLPEGPASNAGTSAKATSETTDSF